MITPEDYELALLEKLRLDFAGSAVRVFGTENGRLHTILGRYSLVPRQLDAAAYRRGASRPFLIADAKRHSTKLDVKDVEAFMGMVDDVGAEMGLLVAPMGFTKAVARRAAAASTHVWVMTIEQALTCEWLPLAREIYPYDWVFREELALAVRRLHERTSPDDIIEALEPVAFEEWDSFVAYALAHHQAEAVSLLHAIASDHLEDGWRFNAIRHYLSRVCSTSRKSRCFSQGKRTQTFVNS
jgi:Restriction endonuclease